MYPFQYEIEFVDETDGYNINHTCGVLMANDYKDAMEALISYYGDTIVDILHLYGLEECSVCEFNEDFMTPFIADHLKQLLTSK